MSFRVDFYRRSYPSLTLQNGDMMIVREGRAFVVRAAWWREVAFWAWWSLWN